MDLLCNLKQAVINDDIKTVEEILLYHCDSPNQRSLLLNSPLDSDSSSLLHLAANISSNMINLLLLHGAYIDHQDNDGYAALHFAVINGCIEGVKALLANGANLELIDDEMMTPQDHAAGKDNILCLFDDVKIIDEDNGVNDISMCQTFVNLMMNDTAIVADDDDDTVTMITDKVAELKIEKDNKTTTSDEKENTILLSSIDDACNLSSLSNEQLRDKLLSYGERPGPINNNTRKAYITYLEKIISGIQPCGNHGYNGIKYELALCLNEVIPLPLMIQDEKEAFDEFRSAGQSKAFFNYLLLDSQLILSSINFKQFVEAIFYVGKGKNRRSFQHLKDALSSRNKQKSQFSAKIERIWAIWEKGHGVISLHIFNGIADGEAYCREGAIIDAIGINNLTNTVKGHYHGAMSGWPISRCRLFGVYLLNKSFQLYQIDSPQPLYPKDI